ncbi:MAG: type I phosphomannose isomerase catalytic subunit [Planctomycetota bacterium]
MNPYPLLFEPILVPKVWGGDRLGALGKRLPRGAGVGESWELADLPQTSTSGAGGGGRHSLIANGPLKGASIAKAIRQWGGDLIPGRSLTADGAFPMLVKLLDAREHLSVQVHPSPTYSRANPDAHLKTECWYVMRAEPGPGGEPPVLFKGFRAGVSEADYAACLDRAGRGIEDLIETVPAVPGEMHDLPSGTIHALGAGVLVAEVQTPSDTTFRVFDWNDRYGRPRREMHHDQARASTLFEAPPPIGRAERSGDVLVENEFYRVVELIAAGDDVALSSLSSPCTVLMNVAGGPACVRCAAGAFRELTIPVGGTALVPAACVGSTVLGAAPGTRLLAAAVG